MLDEEHAATLAVAKVQDDLAELVSLGVLET
jgi:hypothetical protein